MASHRYGRIYHNDTHYINLRFPNVDARREYAEKFQEYHAGHEHDGAVPRFEEITAATIGGFNVWDIPEADSVNIDGYHAHEIEEYHERKDDRYIKYRPPTCCVPPLISIDRKFVDSSTLTRHELSAVFGDMPEQDYQSLLESIQRDGIMDEVIRLIGDEVLDGWHRYRAAKELNLIRKLRFQQWDTREDHDGDPAAFVLARNIERRHLTPQQRGQIVVSFNKRFSRGDIDSQRSGTPSGVPKTRQQLAKEAGVGMSTIDRAVQVEKAGKSEAVITGEKSASEVLLESNRAKAQDAEVAMWKAFENSQLSKWLDKDDLAEEAAKALQCPAQFPDPMNMKRPEIWVCWFEAITLTLQQGSGWVKELLGKFVEDERADAEDEADWEQRQEAEKAKKEIEDAREDVKSSRYAMWKVRNETGLSEHSTPDEFQIAAVKSLGLSEDAKEYMYESVEDPLLDLPLSGLRTWRSRFDSLTIDIEQGSEWAKAFIPQPDTTVEPDPEQAHSEHVEQLKSLPVEIRDYIPKWIRANSVRQAEFVGYEDRVTLKGLLNARCQLVHGTERGSDPFFKEEMEDLLHRMKTSDEALVAKVLQLCGEYNPVTAEEAAQMERDYPSIDFLDKPEAEESLESDKQDPDPDEWNEKWLPQLVDVFEAHAVKYVAVSIDQAVIQDYGSLPWKLSVEDLKCLISDAKTVIEHAKTPQVAWKRNRGKEDISWALKVLGLDQKEDSELNSEDVDTSNALAVVEFKVTAHGKATVIPGVSITDGTITNDEFDEILYSLEEDLKRHLATNGIVVRG